MHEATPIPELWSPPEVMSGAVCLADTVVPIADIWALAADGKSAGAICGAYPQILPEVIQAAVGMVEWPQKSAAFDNLCEFLDHPGEKNMDSADLSAIVEMGSKRLPTI